MSNTFNQQMGINLANRGKNPKNYKVQYVRGNFTVTEHMYGTYAEVKAAAGSKCYMKSYQQCYLSEA